MDTFANRLKKLRLERKLTGEKLGDILNVTKVTVSRWETGERTPDMDTLIKIADFFDVSLDYLFCRTDDPNCRILTNKDLPFETDDKLEIGIKKDAELTEEMLNFIIETFKKSGMEIKFKNTDPKKCD